MNAFSELESVPGNHYKANIFWFGPAGLFRDLLVSSSLIHPHSMSERKTPKASMPAHPFHYTPPKSFFLLVFLELVRLKRKPDPLFSSLVLLINSTIFQRGTAAKALCRHKPCSTATPWLCCETPHLFWTVLKAET